MAPRIIRAFHVRDYVIHLSFLDGTEGEIDLWSELDGEIFEPLRDQEYFKTFSLNSELHTIVWPNGADFAPEFLHKRIQVHV